MLRLLSWDCSTGGYLPPVFGFVFGELGRFSRPLRHHLGGLSGRVGQWPDWRGPFPVGLLLTLLAFGCIWGGGEGGESSDIGAYIGGKWLGRTPLI